MSGGCGGNRKRVYLFIVNENNSVVDEREKTLKKLRPDFVANGQIRHCAKENVLFWLKTNILTLGHLMAIWFFYDPASIEGVKTSLTDLGNHVTDLEQSKVPTMQ